MPLGKPIRPAQLIALQGQPYLYETLKQMLEGHNLLIGNLGPGEALKRGGFVLAGMGSTAAVSGIEGTFKRGCFTLTVNGTGITANPKVTLTFPSGLFAEKPFALVVRNGGTGTLDHTWTVSTTQLIITLAGTPVAGQTFSFEFSIRE